MSATRILLALAWLSATACKRQWPDDTPEQPPRRRPAAVRDAGAGGAVPDAGRSPDAGALDAGGDAPTAVERLCPAIAEAEIARGADVLVPTLRKECEAARAPRGVRCSRYAAAYARLGLGGRPVADPPKRLKVGDKIVEKEGTVWSPDDEMAHLAAAGNACALAALLSQRIGLPPEGSPEAEARASEVWEGALALVLREWSGLPRADREALAGDLVGVDLAGADGSDASRVAVRARLAAAERCATRIGLPRAFEALAADIVPEARRSACAAGDARACSGPVPAWLRGPFSEPEPLAPGQRARAAVRPAARPTGLECRQRRPG